MKIKHVTMLTIISFFSGAYYLHKKIKKLNLKKDGTKNEKN